MKKPSVMTVYDILYTHFGPQGWWPITPRGAIKPRYGPGKYRRPRTDKQFEICVGAILTQNTAWKNVEKALENIHRHRMCCPDVLAKVPVKKLADYIRPSGYFNQKAQRVQNFARYIVTRYEGNVGCLLKQPLPDARAELLSLSGVGPETADSMLLYAGGHIQFVVDAYTMRIGTRLGWYRDASYDEVQRYFQRYVSLEYAVYNEYHALLVALGKDYCKPQPVCAACPLREYCKEAHSYG